MKPNSGLDRHLLRRASDDLSGRGEGTLEAQPGRSVRRARLSLGALALLLFYGLSPIGGPGSADAAPPLGRNEVHKEDSNVDGRLRSGSATVWQGTVEPTKAPALDAGGESEMPKGKARRGATQKGAKSGSATTNLEELGKTSSQPETTDQAPPRNRASRKPDFRNKFGGLGSAQEAPKLEGVPKRRDVRDKLRGRGDAGPAPKRADRTSGSSDPFKVSTTSAGGAAAGVRAPERIEPKLPDLTTSAKIWIDGRVSPLEIVENRRPPYELRWDVSARNRADGVAILVTASQLSDPCDSAKNLQGLVSQGLAGSGFHFDTTGRVTIDFGPGTPGDPLAITACGFDRTQGRNVNINQAGNLIQARRSALGDLVVSGIRVRGKDVGFTVSEGSYSGTVSPGQLGVEVIRISSAYPSGFKTHPASVSLGQPLGGSRKSTDFWINDVYFDAGGAGRIRVCVNTTRGLPEQDFTNNCRELETQEVFPDLVVTRSEFALQQRGEDKGLFREILEGGFFSFDGPPGRCGTDECIVVVVSNQGDRTSAAANIRARVRSGEKLVASPTGEIPALAPGQVVSLELIVARRQSVGSETLLDRLGAGCCSGDVVVDPGGQIIESNERNNRRELEVTRPGATRPGVRDKRNN